MSRSRFGLRGACVALALSWLATLATPQAAQAGSDQIQGAAVAACSTSTTALAQNGFNYPNVDAHGNLCTVPASGGGGATAVTGAAGAFVDGWSVTDGSTTDAACSTDNGTCSDVALLKRDNQRLTSLIAALSSLFQAGGSIGNTAFGISGTLPAYASTPTFNCGTGCFGAAPFSSTQAGSTVTTHLTFQSALASNASRHGCLIVNTSADTELIYFGATGSATSSSSIPLPAGQGLNCASGGIVLTDNIAITSKTTDGAAFVVVSQ